MKRVFLVTYGPDSKSKLILESDVQWFLKQLPELERKTALLVGTNLNESDFDFISRTNEIIRRHEIEIEEAQLNLRDRLKRSRGA